MKLLKLSAILIAGSLLFGCATPAKVENMEVNNTSKMHFAPSLSSAIAVDKVSGGKKTNPMLKSQIGNSEFQGALKNSLKSFDLLSINKEPDYELSATIMDVEQPTFGLDAKVTSSIRYVLVEKSSDKVVFDEIIKAPYTAKFSDAFSGVTRLRMANEGSAKTNIVEFLHKLSTLKIDTSKIELVTKS